MLAWVLVWAAFLALGRRGAARQPSDPRLVFYSTGVFVSVTLFYVVAFAPLWRGGAPPSLSSGLAWFSGISIALGAALMTVSRWQLRCLTLNELFFSHDPSAPRIRTGLYRHLRHPMYVGLALVLLGSLLAYPSLAASLLVLVAVFCIEKKRRIEAPRHAG